MSKLNSFIASLLVLAVVAGGILMSSEPAQGEVILACVDMTNGNTRIVESFDNCRQNEVPKSWTIEGEQGPQGEQGDQGEQGIQGAQGPPGEPGGLSGYERLVEFKTCVNHPDGVQCQASIFCTDNKLPLGGSCQCGIANVPSSDVLLAFSFLAVDGYICGCINETGGSADITTDVVVVCADSS